MKILEAKFPPVQQVEWTRYLRGLSVERQGNVFPEFLNWLDVEGEVWVTMESKGSASAVQAKTSTKPVTTLYSSDGSAFTGNCYKCRKKGILR